MSIETTAQIQLEKDLKMPKRIDIADMDTSRYMFFGSGFILGVNAALFPLDTLTTIVMADKHQGKKQSIFKLVKRIAKTQGIFRFWKGLVPSGNL